MWRHRLATVGNCAGTAGFIESKVECEAAAANLSLPVTTGATGERGTTVDGAKCSDDKGCKSGFCSPKSNVCEPASSRATKDGDDDKVGALKYRPGQASLASNPYGCYYRARLKTLWWNPNGCAPFTFPPPF